MTEETHDVEADPLFPRVCAAGASLRRIDRAEKLNDEGERSVWHQGAELTELITWEDDKTIIQRQELTFLGMALEYRRGHGLRTGTVEDERGDSGALAADLVNYDSFPSLRILELSARMLREAKRDYYTQHLLQQLNDALTTRFNRPQTQVYGLPRWRDRLRRASDGLLRRRGTSTRKQIIIYMVVGAILGALLTLALLRFV